MLNVNTFASRVEDRIFSKLLCSLIIVINRNNGFFANPTSCKNLCRCVASFATSIRIIYSASVLDNTTVRCFLASRLAAPCASTKTAVYDFQFSARPAQSASTKPFSFCETFLYFNPSVEVPRRYRRILQAAVQ